MIFSGENIITVTRLILVTELNIYTKIKKSVLKQAPLRLIKKKNFFLCLINLKLLKHETVDISKRCINHYI